MLRFRIANMGCGGCAKSVAEVLRIADPAAQAEFDLGARVVAIASGSGDADRLNAALQSAGWKSELLPG